MGMQPAACQAELLQYRGVGRKVADCISLYAFDKRDVVPVDTHVLQIARRMFPYRKELFATKSVTPHMYEVIEGLFYERYGDHAGWAQAVLFSYDLPKRRTNQG
eukprot:GHVN01082376.1.p1 GENE.GHVN01082376.1~~GHVN01082376.1.p1  ORF type:complete len:104 (+),score=3.99 GHVN01082376.1:560-871(+)